MPAWLATLLTIVQVVAALGVIVLVLIQHGKGADMGASFGGGSSGSLFGATGSANFLSRSTAACATLFFCCTLALPFMSNSVRGPSTESSSVLDRAAPVAPAAPSAPATGVIPGTQPAMPATPASGATGAN